MFDTPALQHSYLSPCAACPSHCLLLGCASKPPKKLPRLVHMQKSAQTRENYRSRWTRTGKSTKTAQQRPPAQQSRFCTRHDRTHWCCPYQFLQETIRCYLVTTLPSFCSSCLEISEAGTLTCCWESRFSKSPTCALHGGVTCASATCYRGVATYTVCRPTFADEERRHALPGGLATARKKLHGLPANG